MEAIVFFVPVLLLAACLSAIGVGAFRLFQQMERRA